MIVKRMKRNSEMELKKKGKRKAIAKKKKQRKNEKKNTHSALVYNFRVLICQYQW